MNSNITINMLLFMNLNIKELNVYQLNINNYDRAHVAI